MRRPRPGAAAWRDKPCRDAYNLAVATPVQAQQLEAALRDFDRIATLVARDEGGRREIWTFSFEGRGYYLIFYPRRRSLDRFYSPGLALLEFTRLQAMQRASIPAPHAVAHLSGFRVEQRPGDAVIVDAIPGAIQLDRYLLDLDLRGLPVPNRFDLADQVIQIIDSIWRANFGHSNLRLGSFLVAEGKIFLHDVLPLRRGGLQNKDLFVLAHNASRFATRTELLRGWETLKPTSAPPRRNPLSPRLWKRFLKRTRRQNDDFGTIAIAQWSGHFTRTARFARAWSIASRIGASEDDWQSAWPILLAQLQSDQLELIKRDASGEVFSGQVIIREKPISVIVKRPFRKRWYRFIYDLLRPAKPMRMWLKAWQLISRNIPCEWPMLVMQRRVLGYAIDGIVVFERVPGESLDRVDLDSMDARQREMLFRRAGRTTRAIERAGLAHYDAKSTNWIVYQDSSHGAIPVMIDVDGVRKLNVWLVAWGIQRLLRAMKQHPQYTPADSLALCQGYAPFAGGFEREGQKAEGRGQKEA